MIRTFSDNVLAKSAFNTAITAAANNGAVIDTLGYRHAAAVFDTSPSGAATTSDCKLQEGAAADGSDMADVATAAFTQATTVGGHTIQVMNIDLAKRKRYVRLVHTGAGGAAAGRAQAAIYLLNGEAAPPAQDLAAVSI